MLDSSHRPKLIEVDMPLLQINSESAKDNYLRVGHPRTMHMWWARRPLAACRAIIFASLVDDPSGCPEFPTPELADAEREVLHGLIAELIKWSSTDMTKQSNVELLNRARRYIAQSVARGKDKPAPTEPEDVLAYLDSHKGQITVYDPFSGGGSIPLEAQRLGLPTIGTDLNPVAVVLTKCLVELPAMYRQVQQPSGCSPSKVDDVAATQSLGNDHGHLPTDFRKYASSLRDIAFNRLSEHLPPVELEDGSQAEVVAWLWANAVPCANLACIATIPLKKSFRLRTTPSKLWSCPKWQPGTTKPVWVIQDHDKGIPNKDETVSRSGVITCTACKHETNRDYLRAQFVNGRATIQLTAIVAESNGKRIYVAPNASHENAAESAKPAWRPQGAIPGRARSISVQGYGFTEWSHLFTDRQTLVLNTFVDSINTVREQMLDDGVSETQVNILCTYLALTIGKLANVSNRLAWWDNDKENVVGVFGGQSIGMVYDFAESNPFSKISKSYDRYIENIAKVLDRLPTDVNPGVAEQANALNSSFVETGPVILTDPPYYDNVGFGDISDFFYVWLRPAIRDIYPRMFASSLVLKDDELVVAPRFDNARSRFEDLMAQTLRRIRDNSNPAYPSSIMYAYRQSVEEKDGEVSTGWETMLNALVNAKFVIVGTWPIRTESGSGLRMQGSTKLASSIVLVCRPRPDDAPVATRNEFLAQLGPQLGEALDRFSKDGHIAQLDLRQAAIGPGMQVFSKYSSVITLDNEPVSIREALQHINGAFDRYFERQFGELDGPSRFCVEWLGTFGWKFGPAGAAEVQATAMNGSVSSLLLDWDFAVSSDSNLRMKHYDQFDPSIRDSVLSDASPAWEGLMRMAFHISDQQGQGVRGCAEVAGAMGAGAQKVQRLARVLFERFRRNDETDEILVYDEILREWGEIQRQSERYRAAQQAHLPVN